ncbi:hypothetical protein GOP47_0005198 [Adiantum capillus-veneris]|uniref:Uncharacterized protein n=1 Tax=Adiantum capillus-veneris TaxID=13818 RepID=A0A9D4ZLC5_ADICA|nr:hypothetical protein GOP47_0005198 [Adiantum capillus-veneris]
MKKNTPLDYAEFLLTHSRTRCELHIYSNGVKEKLASGYLKPFVAHLREAEAQVANGNQVIRLERPSNFLKKNKVTWFTKGTLERFVRFVSTPEVLERVKNIDDELSQLEHVRVALSMTSPQSEDPFYSMETTCRGIHQAKGNGPMKNRKLSMTTGDNGADGSKIDLLRAMDVRLVALKQEQSDAFSRAMAAGFDSSNMADLLDFSEHFGAERLREACIQFIGLFRRRNIAQEISGVEFPSVDAASSDSDMSLESCTDVELLADHTGKYGLVGSEGEWPKTVKNRALDNAGKLEMKEERKILGSKSSVRTRSRWGPPERLHINHVDPELPDCEIFRKKEEAKLQLGNYNRQDDIRDSVRGLPAFEAGEEFQATKEQPQKSSSTDCLVPSMSSSAGNRMQQGEGNIRAGMFYSRLHKMALQVEARRSSEDLGVPFTSVERSAELSGSQLSGYGYSSSLNASGVDSSGDSPLSVVSDAFAAGQHKQENTLVAGQFSEGRTSVLEEAPKVVGDSETKSVVDHVATKDGDNLEKSGKPQSATGESSEVRESQEERSSTSARRLSVKAAISLFEGKKATVGEPPTRNLVRQDSQKAAFQSGSSATEKSVLRRWSGLGSDGTSGKQDTATEVGENWLEKAAVTENAAQKAESLSSTRMPMSAIDMSSTHAALSAVQAVPGEPSLLKKKPSTQQKEISSEAPSEVLPKQANQELEKFFVSRGSSNNLRENAVCSCPSEPPADILKPSEVTSRSTMVPETGNKDVRRAFVRKEVVDTQSNFEVQPTQNSKEPKMPGSLSIHETAPKRSPSYKEAEVNLISGENLEVNSLKHKIGKSRLAERNLQLKNTPEPDKEPSLILHETPVDLYMQALVMIIDKHHQSGLGDEESFKDQRGRFYDRYRQLRNARQKGENPAKRAEREAKLKSMQEILERRKAEMEAGVFRQMKNSRSVKEQEGVVQYVKMSVPLLIPQKEKEMGEDEVEGQQDDLVLALPHTRATSKTKVQPAREGTPKLQKSASTSRSLLITTPVSFPRTMPTSTSATGVSVNNQCKGATSSCNMAVDSKNPPVDLTRDSRNSTSVCVEPSDKPHGTTSGYSQFADSAVSLLFENVLSRTANAGLPCQPSDTGKDRSFSSDGGPLCGQAHHRISITTSKGNVKSDAIAFMEEEALSPAQNGKLVLHQGHDNFSTPGTGLTKHEFFDHMHSSASLNEQSCSSFDGAEDGTMFVSCEAEDLGIGKSLEPSIVNHAVKDSSLMHLEKPRPNAEISTSSVQNPLEFLKGESVAHMVEEASNKDKVSFVDQVGQEKTESNSQRDRMQILNVYEEGAAWMSVEKSIELSQSDSVCSPSLQQECTSTTYSDGVSSPVLEESSGTVRGPYNPKLSKSLYSPSRSPSWTYSKAKHPSEHERNSNVPQSSKEPPRGFKRLLHFGRKNRTSEAISSDGVSVSTASEGDDETEEIREPMRQSPNERFQRVVSKEKGWHVGSTKDYSSFQDQETTHSLQSNIPIPPSNFKLRDDHFLGGSSLKASRSFFSLSSFRNRGGEGKSR